jgi:hypothetical protein
MSNIAHTPSIMTKPAWRRYMTRYLIGMAAYGALLVPMMLAAFSHRLPGKPWVYVVTGAPALGVAAVVWSMLWYLEEEDDEYQRLLNTRAFIAAAGLVLVLTTGWGLMQWFAGLPKVSLFYVFPLFLACQGFTTSWVRWRAR